MKARQPCPRVTLKPSAHWCGTVWQATSVEGTMAHLFRGKFTNYLRCVNVEDVSTRDEDFYDLQMPVKGCKDLYASLDEYVKEETLEGENQYQSERFGKQDAKKGVSFKSLPPVLELHLRRFEYDFTTDAMAKVCRSAAT